MGMNMARARTNMLLAFAFPVILLASNSGVAAEARLSHLDGLYRPFFKGVENDVSTEEAREMLHQLEYVLSNDKKNLIFGDGCGGPIDFEAKSIDLNGDSIKEIVIQSGNSCTSGAAGTSATIFMKNAASHYSPVISSLPGVARPLKTVTNGFIDVEIIGPGLCAAIWKWDLNKYKWSSNNCNLKEK